jgi:hypothetical protein
MFHRKVLTSTFCLHVEQPDTRSLACKGSALIVKSMEITKLDKFQRELEQARGVFSSLGRTGT